jgi:hypothetical protein
MLIFAGGQDANTLPEQVAASGNLKFRPPPEEVDAYRTERIHDSSGYLEPDEVSSLRNLAFQ